MPTPPLPDSLALEALEALEKHDKIYLAAKALDLNRSTFLNRVKVAKQRGLQLSDGAGCLRGVSRLHGKVAAPGDYIPQKQGRSGAGQRGALVFS